MRKRDPSGEDGVLLTAFPARNRPGVTIMRPKAVRVDASRSFGARVNRPQSYRAASIFGMPTSFTVRVKLYASAVRLNSARTFSRPRIRK